MSGGRCPYCRSERASLDDGRIVCEGCGADFPLPPPGGALELADGLEAQVEDDGRIWIEGETDGGYLRSKAGASEVRDEPF